jgi:DNA adenine methylase
MVLRYRGGKARIAPWVVKQFPIHTNYYEPFCGGRWVDQAKRKAPGLNVMSDLNQRTINFWLQLRDNPQAIYDAIAAEPLEKLMETVPCSFLKKGLKFKKRGATFPTRATYDRFDQWYQGHEDPSIDAAYYYLQGLYGFLGVGVDNSSNPSPSRASTRPNILKLHQQHLRLQNVEIKLQCALEAIATAPTENTLIYLDPPYDHKERRSTSSRPKVKGEKPFRAYVFEGDDEFHAKLCKAALDFSDRGGMVIISNYPNELYDDLLPWRTEQKEIRHYNTKEDQDESPPIEKLWLCPNVKPAQKPLFDFYCA